MIDPQGNSIKSDCGSNVAVLPPLIHCAIL
jgi:hypothetical protein